MSNIQQSFSAGQSQGQTQEKAEQWTESAKQGTANAAQSVEASAERGTQQGAGLLQQTGDQMKSAAQSTVDTVRSVLRGGN